MTWVTDAEALPVRSVVWWRQPATAEMAGIGMRVYTTDPITPHFMELSARQLIHQCSNLRGRIKVASRVYRWSILYGALKDDTLRWSNPKGYSDLATALTDLQSALNVILAEAYFEFRVQVTNRGLVRGPYLWPYTN